VIVPIICKLVKPKSVVDVGCGTGAWLLEFQQNGADDIFGIEGPWLNKSQLRIPLEKVAISNLKDPISIPRKFDLVVSLEVAEHLPESSADTFIDSLCNLGPVVLFSAAIPHQGGTNHLNEQWPDYWAALFKKRNYTVVDCVRKLIWMNSEVDAYYAQNILVFINQDKLREFPALLECQKATSIQQLSIVHPRYWSNYADLKKLPVMRIVRALPYSLAGSVRHRIRGIKDHS
jgi:SAM-dependent methyltransferase